MSQSTGSQSTGSGYFDEDSTDNNWLLDASSSSGVGTFINEDSPGKTPSEDLQEPSNDVSNNKQDAFHRTGEDNDSTSRSEFGVGEDLRPDVGLKALDEALLLSISLDGDTPQRGDTSDGGDDWIDAIGPGKEGGQALYNNGSKSNSSVSGILKGSTQKSTSTNSFGSSIVENGFEMEAEAHKTVRFAMQLATPIEFTESQGSFGPSLDNLNGKNADLMDGSSSLHSSINDEDDDDSFVSAVSEEDEDAKIKRHMMYALGGVGLLALVGFAIQKLLSCFAKNDDPEVGLDITNAADVADAAGNINDVATLAAANDGGSSAATAVATEATNQAAFHASASASQSQNGVGAFGGVGNGGAQSMSAAQTQVLQGMAVNAASNAASSAASASSALLSTAASAAGMGAATGAAASTTIFMTVVS
jgi:hypothetical protein